MKTTTYIFRLMFFISFSIESLYAQKIPKDFRITFKFGFHEKDATTFDSNKKTLIVHGTDTVMTYILNLSEQEKQTIYNELQKINYINYPEKYIYQHPDSEEAFISSPCQHYFLTVFNNHYSKAIEWDNCVGSKTKDEKHTALMQLDRVIEKIIWARNPLKDYHPSQISIDPD